MFNRLIVKEIQFLLICRRLFNIEYNSSYNRELLAISMISTMISGFSFYLESHQIYSIIIYIYIVIYWINIHTGIN